MAEVEKALGLKEGVQGRGMLFLRQGEPRTVFWKRDELDETIVGGTLRNVVLAGALGGGL